MRTTKIGVALRLLVTCALLTSASAIAESSDAKDSHSVNIAKPEWGTRITATTVFSDKYAPSNLADGEIDGPHCWFGKDGATLPQQVVFAFAGVHALTGMKLTQAQWIDLQYHSKDFTIETSMDGQAWKAVTSGTLKPEAGSHVQLSFDSTEAKSLRITLTSTYDTVRPCGLAEVEIYSMKPSNVTPPYAGAARDLRWDAFGRHFLLQLELDPAAPLWMPDANNTPASQVWTSDAYRLELKSRDQGDAAQVIEYALTRTDNQPFRVTKSRIEFKSSYARVYKIFTPGSMTQQNYRIDLPFRIEGGARAEIDSPVIWMQETSGDNTLTVGMFDQVPVTHFEGSTYDPSNGGEAPGIANSYVRAGFVRTPQTLQPVRAFKDGLYINANNKAPWYDALRGYADAVDAWRGFAPKPVGKNAFRSMWHSWYAHADKIDQAELLEDAKRSASLGVQTLEIDAGWNIGPGVAYSFDVEGDYDFHTGRFPDAKAMIGQVHDMGLAVILHVAPLLMGKQAKAYPAMKDCILREKGKDTAYLDPRLAKTRDYLVNAWEKLQKDYRIDGFWYDFLEIPEEADPPAEGLATISPDLHEAYTLLMRQLYEKALTNNPDVVIVLRRGSANLNAKTYSTHAWPMDTPQDYNMNRRDIVYLKTYGAGILTHACCTSWPISESDENVARQMASITMAGVPAFSVKLPESPESHNAIIRAWLKFYDTYKEDLMLGQMTPLLPTPPSAAIRIEGAKGQAFFGFFEAVPGLIQVTKPATKIILVNGFSNRLTTRLETVEGTFEAKVFDQEWKPLSTSTIKSDGKGVNLDFSAPTRCFTVVLERTP
ncbi:MAG: discoidin domain-containing protein [Candidatus Hydrogenedentes bacterium]|nr:discoidin domain-containing protein [Candidatus Hydrogenedentota bacterium]